MSNNVFVLNIKRSAIGKYGGKLSSLPITDVASEVIRDVLRPFPKLKDKINEVIFGNVISSGLGQNPARIVAFKAGLSEEIPAFIVNQVCGSGLKSIILGTQVIKQGDAECILAGGMEGMSRCPYLLENYRFGVKFGHQIIKDSVIYDGIYCSLIGKHMGVTAENIAKKYKISRENQDKYALRSHRKAILAIDNGIFKTEITPINIEQNSSTVFREDEQPRRDTSLKLLNKLKTVFQNPGTVTAGNSSSLNDGAAVALLVSEKLISRYNLKPKAIIRSYAVVGFDPNFMGLGAYYAAVKCLKKVKMPVNNVNLWEINEAFASQVIAVIEMLGINQDIVNVNGGAIALGHPIGASGTRILATLIYEMKRRKVKFGVATLCIGGGGGIAILVENVESR